MQSDFFRIFKITIFVLLAITAIIIDGCAVSSTALLEDEHFNNKRAISTYRELIIEEFELPLSEDSSDKRYGKMPQIVAENIAKIATAKSIFSKITINQKPSADALVLSGKFSRISRFKILLHAKIKDASDNSEVARFKVTLWDIYDTSKVYELIAEETAAFLDKLQYK